MPACRRTTSTASSTRRVVRASTVLFENVDAMPARRGARYSYGLTNTPTIEALTSALTALEGAAGTVLVPSGLAAVTTAHPRRCAARQDDPRPRQRLCADPALLRRDACRPSASATVYYDPLIGGGIAGPSRRRLRRSFLEAPGSHTFEMPDMPAMVAAAKAAGVSRP